LLLLLLKEDDEVGEGRDTADMHGLSPLVQLSLQLNLYFIERSTQ